MKYSLAFLSLAVAVAAEPAFTNLAFDVTEGQPFTLEFTGCEGGCSIILQNGNTGDLKDVQELTNSASGGSFTFTPEDLTTDTYTFKIVNNETGEDNYSQQFEYEGEDAAPSTTVETVTTSIVKTITSESTTEESTTTPTTTSVTTVTTPATTVTETETSSETSTDDATGSETSGAPEASEIPDPDDAAMGLGAPMTLVVAAVAGLLIFN